MILGIAFTEALFLFAILVSSLQVLTSSNEQALRARVEGDARLFGAAAASALVSDDVASLHSIARQVVRNKGIRYAAAWDGRGRLLAHAGRVPDHPNFVKGAYTVRAAGTSYGRVEVVVTRKALRAAVHQARQRITSIALSEMVFVGLVAWFLGTYLMRQIAALERATARIAAGEFGFVVPVKSSDELGRLMGEFNAMSVKLKSFQEAAQQQHQELAALNTQLETRVHERTTALASANRELEYLALHDPLTGLPNRILLQDRLLQAVRGTHREGAPFALMIMDLDGFKDVNDSLGHHAGDQLLREMGARLQKTLRHSDVAVRLGGDEFAFLLPTVATAEHVELLARKLLDIIEEPVVLGGQKARVTASMGAVLFPMHGVEVGDLLRRADRAMYEAKRQHAGFLLFTTSMEDEGDDRLRLQGDLERAIAVGELVLHYQPKIDLLTNKVSGVEALVRWQHPQLGLLPPDRFVPLAESTRLIKPLTLDVLRQAIRQARLWMDAGRPLPIAVNVSVVNLDDPGFVEELNRLLQAAAIPRGLIELEITETALMRDPERARSCIQQLADMGVRVSIDDFGTGYSSMTYLRKLAVAKIKIDKSFVLDMGVSRNDSVIVRSIIDLGHSLGLKVVAEGVESAESLQVLTNLGCDFAQGYHFAKALEVSALEAWMAARS